MTRLKEKKHILSTTQGFTLIELVVVLAGLAILSGLAVPNISKILDFNNIDEAKSLLNAAAADCLQKSRLSDKDERESIDENIISNKRLNPIGFELHPDHKKCNYLQLRSTQDNDEIRFPIGFSVDEGILSKFAEPISDDKGSLSSCEKWAGESCKKDESLLELIEWKESIRTAKSKCYSEFTTWKDSGTIPNKYRRWNTNAESNCPSRPKDNDISYKNSPTCTPNGCNKVVHGLEGELCLDTEDFDDCVTRKYGEACNDWKAGKKQEGFSNINDNGIKFSPKCGDIEHWFVDGEAYTEIDKYILYRDNKFCKEKRESDRKNNYSGIWGPEPGRHADALTCNQKIYMCNKTIYNDETDYFLKCDPQPPEKCKGTLWPADSDCTEWELSNYLINIKGCGNRPTKAPTYCRTVGAGAPSKGGGWDRNDDCANWAKCTLLYK